MKRTISLILILALLACAAPASAANAGSAQDPLISKSYITGKYTSDLLQQLKTLLTAAETAVKDYLGKKLPAGGGSPTGGEDPLSGYRSLNAAAGSTYTLPFGSSLILLSGSGTVECSGALLDTSAGREVASGTSLSKNVRYLVLEDSSAAFTINSKAQLMIEGKYSTGSVQLPDFTDLPKEHYAYTAVRYFVEHQYVSGVGENRFDPGGNMTRGMFVTLLGRVHGVNTGSYPGSSFADVPANAYYAPYVQWASRTGLVSGVGDNKFEPERPITRQEMAKLVVDFADYAGYKLDTKNSVIFTDDAKIASWAKTPVYRAAWAGLITGRDGGIFDPLNTAARAEVCTLVYRLITA